MIVYDEKPDIVDELREMALQVDDRPVSEIEALLEKAAHVIETLRTLIGIRREVELEDSEPKGRC